MEYQFETTLDGSPTLRFVWSENSGQSMHSLQGAFGETLYIYGQAVSETLSRQFQPRFLSIGLGLGYVEMMAFAVALSFGLDHRSLHLDSYEKDQTLIARFRQWLTAPDRLHPESPEFARAYAWIAEHTARHFDLEPQTLIREMRQALTLGHLQLHGEFQGQAGEAAPYSTVLFDAFSGAVEPELWREELLDSVCCSCAQLSVFATYAATSRLKRVLLRHGFVSIRSEGFGGKRESTLMVRSRLPLAIES